MADTLLEETRNSLARVHTFDVATLPREAALGEFNFKNAVQPASRVIRLLQQFPLEALPELPENELGKLKGQADSFYRMLQDILKFSAKQDNPSNAHTAALTSLNQQHQQVFNSLHQLIAYGSSRQRDVAGLERDFRAAIQAANDRADEMTKSLAADQQEAQRVLADIRKVAEEQGVSQQAYYFSKESDHHEAEAKTWRNWTVGTAVGLGVYAAASAVLHKSDWLKPVDTYDTVQLAISKVLIFAVIAYMLILCARNYLSHKHNAVVNKHRQNALLTFKALVNAAGTEEHTQCDSDLCGSLHLLAARNRLHQRGLAKPRRYATEYHSGLAETGR